VPIREFTDSSGGVWRVWITVPARGSVRDPDYRNGWLTFETKGARRRLAPAPVGWQEASDARLELMCRAASDVGLGRGPHDAALPVDTPLSLGLPDLSSDASPPAG
jgi:hypothetical protein